MVDCIDLSLSTLVVWLAGFVCDLKYGCCLIVCCYCLGLTCLVFNLILLVLVMFGCLVLVGCLVILGVVIVAWCCVSFEGVGLLFYDGYDGCFCVCVFDFAALWLLISVGCWFC